MFTETNISHACLSKVGHGDHSESPASAGRGFGGTLKNFCEHKLRLKAWLQFSARLHRRNFKQVVPKERNACLLFTDLCLAFRPHCSSWAPSSVSQDEDSFFFFLSYKTH